MNITGIFSRDYSKNSSSTTQVVRGFIGSRNPAVVGIHSVGTRLAGIQAVVESRWVGILSAVAGNRFAGAHQIGTHSAEAGSQFVEVGNRFAVVGNQLVAIEGPATLDYPRPIQ